MKTRLHGTTAISLCSADEERTPDQAQWGKKAGWEARGICASVCMCVCVCVCVCVCACVCLGIGVTTFCCFLTEKSFARGCALPLGQICRVQEKFFSVNQSEYTVITKLLLRQSCPLCD